MADNKQNPNQKDRTNDAVGMPADEQNQRGNQNMQTQGGSNKQAGNEKMPGGSDRVDMPGDATRGESQANPKGEFQGNPKGESQGNPKGEFEGKDMDRRPSGSDQGQQDRDRDREQQKKPA